MQLFDAHFHIIDPKFPLIPNQGYLPPTFLVNDYQKATSNLPVISGAVVSGSFQAFDQEYLIHALNLLGSNFVGVANIPHNLPREELKRLNNHGIAAVRFNLMRGGSEQIDYLVKMSNELYDEYGWHTELYIKNEDLSALKSVLKSVPRFSIDHLGLTQNGLKDLYYWVEKGIKVKATGFGRLDFDPLPVLKQINQINPEALLFGTDLPSTRAKIPFSMEHFNLLKINFDEKEMECICFQNAVSWYTNNKKKNQ